MIFENQARVVGFDPNAPTVPVDDLSNDPAAAGVVDTDADNDLDNPTAISFQHLTLTQEWVGCPESIGQRDERELRCYSLKLVITNTGNEALFKSLTGGGFPISVWRRVRGVSGSSEFEFERRDGHSRVEPPRLTGTV